MTVAEMISNFLLEYDRLSSASAPGYENTEIIRFLEKAQIEIVSELYRNKQHMLIDTLFLTATYANPGTYLLAIGSKYVDLNTTTIRYMYYIKSYSKLTRTHAPTATATIIQNDDIQKDETKYFITTVVNTPIFRHPKAFLDGALLTIIPDGYTTITEVYVDYLSEPKQLEVSSTGGSKVTTCQLKSVLHDTVVTRAVELALKAGDLERAVPTIQLNKA